MAALGMDRDARRAPIRSQIVHDLLVAREQLVDPDGCDPATSLRPTSGLDALELNAACLALPNYAREVGVAGTPLLWSWPLRTYPKSRDRRAELLQAAALLIAAVERIDAAPADRRRLRVVATSGLPQ